MTRGKVMHRGCVQIESMADARVFHGNDLVVLLAQEQLLQCRDVLAVAVGILSAIKNEHRSPRHREVAVRQKSLAHGIERDAWVANPFSLPIQAARLASNAESKVKGSRHFMWMLQV